MRRARAVVELRAEERKEEKLEGGSRRRLQNSQVFVSRRATSQPHTLAALCAPEVGNTPSVFVEFRASERP